MRPTLAEIAAAAQVVELPMRTPFRGLSVREVLVFEGPQGWSEWSPFVEYEPAEAAVWLGAAIDWAYDEQPQLVRTSVGINATLPAVAAGEVESVLARFGQFETVKVKVGEPGQTILDDLARILRVRVLHPEVKIRIDANGAFKVNEALALVDALEKAHIELEYFEQPVNTIAELAELRLQFSRRENQVLIAADESVRKVSDPLAVAQAQAADLLVLKAAPLGGVKNSFAIAAEAGLPAIISSALETSVGIGMGLHLAAALPELSFDCGLGTVALFENDVCDEPLIAENGKLEIRRATPSQELLDKYQASSEVTDWWLERLADSYAELAN